MRGRGNDESVITFGSGEERKTAPTSKSGSWISKWYEVEDTYQPSVSKTK